MPDERPFYCPVCEGIGKHPARNLDVVGLVICAHCGGTGQATEDEIAQMRASRAAMDKLLTPEVIERLADKIAKLLR